MKGGDPFALISADRTWPYGSSFSSFDCKSEPIRVRLLSDEKKKNKTSHCNSRALFTRKAPTKNTTENHYKSRVLFHEALT